MRTVWTLLLVPLGIFAQSAARAQTGDATRAPAGMVEAATAVGVGVQIYRCEVKGSNGGWVLVGPEAKLFAPPATSGTPVGTHGAGPIWRWSDGSAVIGKGVAKEPSPNKGSLPWLLLSLSPASDSAAAGKLVGMAYVRRSDTVGGDPPGQVCDAAIQGQETRVDYKALYTFYKPAS